MTNVNNNNSAWDQFWKGAEDLGKVLVDGTGAALSVVDELSFGSMTTNGLDMIGMETDGALREGIELAMNSMVSVALTGGVGGIWVAKDAADFALELSGNNPLTGMSGPFPTETPAQAQLRRGNAPVIVGEAPPVIDEFQDQEAIEAMEELNAVANQIRQRITNGGFAPSGSVGAGLGALERGSMTDIMSLRGDADFPSLSALELPASFEDIVAAFMADVVQQQQNDVTDSIADMEKANAEARLKRTAISALKAGATVATVGATFAGTPAAGMITGMATDAAISVLEGELQSDTESRQLQFEKLKQTINKIQQMQTALSNILKAMHDTAMASINNIK